MIVNQLIKEVQFILYKKVLNIEELMYIFLRNETALQDLLDKIIFNRILTRQLRLLHKILTVYHL